jgi:1,6-anhydro-N-acetylmuramate kinase
MKAFLDKIYIGTMSGTSHDGIDICAIKVSNQVSLLKFSSYKYPVRLKRRDFKGNSTTRVKSFRLLRIKQ